MRTFPIRRVAEAVGVPVSTLHYWERRGLLHPSRRSGQRYFDADEFYRVALIKQWREAALMSIEDIEALLDGPLPTGTWQDVVRRRRAYIDQQMAQLVSARAYLDSLLTCQHGDDLARCPAFRSGVADVVS
jgi:DNA-binding transcriptional MerR regulator